MQKKIARILIQLNTNKGHVLRILPGPIMFMRMSKGLLAIYAEQAIEVDSDANVDRTFHIYQSGNEVADGHVFVTSIEGDLGAVYHLYENVGAVPENNRIVKLGQEKDDIFAEMPVSRLVYMFPDDLFSINVVDCPAGVMLLEGARAPIQGVVSVLNMYADLTGIDIVHVVNEVIQTGSTRYVRHLNGIAEFRIDIRVVTETEQMIEKAEIQKATESVKRKAPEYNYVIEVSDLETKWVFIKEVQVPEKAFMDLLSSMMNKSSEDIRHFLDHVKTYEKGHILSTKASSFSSTYRLDVLRVVEV